MPSNFAQDYIEVADRIREWYERHPDGSILTEIVQHTTERVTVRAEVYPDSVMQVGEVRVQASGVGHSSMMIPGSTPFTRGAELENAETSAVGRALVMAGIPSKNVASANEVRAKKSGGAVSGSETAAKRGTTTTTAEARVTAPLPGSSSGGGTAVGSTGDPAPRVPSPGPNVPAGVEPPRAPKPEDPQPQIAGGDASSNGKDSVEGLAVLVASYFGSLSKAVLWSKRTHPEWEIRSENDFTAEHFAKIASEVGA